MNSLFEYTAFKPDGSIETTHKKNPISFKQGRPLRGRRFSDIQISGTVTQENMPALRLFVGDLMGNMRIGARPIPNTHKGNRTSVGISHDREIPGALLIDLMVHDATHFQPIIELIALALSQADA